MKKEENCKDFLLEIDVQDLPVTYIRPAAGQLRDAFLEEFKSLRIRHGEAILYATKNILICYIHDVAEKQEEVSSEVTGPPKGIAFDNKGNLTKQALGFVKAQGLGAEDLRVKKTPKGEYIFVEKKIKARATQDILRELIPGVIKNIHFPKTMKWDSSGFYFARPVESVLALLGKTRVNVNIGNIPLKKTNPVAPAVYLKRLKKEFLIDPDKRKDEIKRLILRTAAKIGADQDVDEALLDEVSLLVDCPGVFAGEFDKKFLALPEEVLRASMAKHQRIFPVSKKGRMENKFIAITNGRGLDVNTVRGNYEKILEARLQDSLFFLEEDMKKPLPKHSMQLKDLIFHKDLGNMFEKIQRLQALSSFICDKLGIERSLKKDIARAAELSKADLVTHMVGEFPSLQGIMGGVYALKAGENKDAAIAIKEHYLPQGADDKLPGGMGGSILAVSDKMDNLVGFLGMGTEISGSFDPFGIRRNAQGMIQIIKNKSLRFKIGEVIEKAIDLYGGRLKVPPPELKNRIAGYIEDRIGSLTGDIRPLGLKRAVLKAGCLDIVDAFNRLNKLSSISNKRDFLEAAKVVERTSNILKGAKEDIPADIDEKLFKEAAEQAVWKAYLGSRERIEELVEKEDYIAATGEYARVFYKVLHEFFDKVMVNVEDSQLRLNRLALMKAINRLYSERIADLAQLPQIVVG